MIENMERWENFVKMLGAGYSAEEAGHAIKNGYTLEQLQFETIIVDERLKFENQVK